MSRAHPGRGRAGKKYIANDEIFERLSKPMPSSAPVAPTITTQQAQVASVQLRHHKYCCTNRHDAASFLSFLCTCSRFGSPGEWPKKVIL